MSETFLISLNGQFFNEMLEENSSEVMLLLAVCFRLDRLSPALLIYGLSALLQGPPAVLEVSRDLPSWSVQLSGEASDYTFIRVQQGDGSHVHPGPCAPQMTLN